jgi:hypothetical protein
MIPGMISGPHRERFAETAGVALTQERGAA